MNLYHSINSYLMFKPNKRCIDGIIILRKIYICNLNSMHYSQHSQIKQEESKKSGKLHSAIEKAQAIQQR